MGTTVVAGGRPRTVVVAVVAVVLAAVLALIPFAAAVREALSPGSIPQLAPPPGTAPLSTVALGVVAAVRGILLVLPLLLALRVWHGSARRVLVGLLVALAALDLARGAVAVAVTVPLYLVAAALLLDRSSRTWAPR